DASGTAGAGGQVRVGGGFHGQDPALANAQTALLSATARLRADGTGPGGRVVVWSEQSTEAAGSVSARGTPGGAIEVSSRGTLTYGASADAGPGGTLLLDPKNLVISAAPVGVFPQFNLVNPGTGGAFGTDVRVLSTGKVLVTDPQVNSSAGAVYLFSGQTGALLSALLGSH